MVTLINAATMVFYAFVVCSILIILEMAVVFVRSWIKVKKYGIDRSKPKRGEYYDILRKEGE